ncbi:MAG: S9 family peptidase [Marinifilaceae bacterium]
MRHLLLIFLCISGIITSVTAQKQQLTLDDFFVKGTFGQRRVSGLRSMNDGLHYTIVADNGKKIVKYSYKTGKEVETLLDLNKLEDCDAKSIQGYDFDPTEQRIIFFTNREDVYRHSFKADYYVYELKNKIVKPLSDGGKQQLATFSPNGIRIAFVRDNNLFIHDVRFGSEIQITYDGKFNEIINGAPDWVYEEEFGFNRAFDWAPDGSALAYIRFDESEVPVFHMNMFRGMAPSYDANTLYPSNYSYKYPKAGEKNSKVSVHVYDIADRTTLPMEHTQLEEFYIPRIKWTNDAKKLAITTLNRHQNNMEVFLANVKTGKSTVLYRDNNKYYIDESNLDNLIFLEDGKHFITTSEKNGFMHLYLYTMGGKEVKAITKGNFDIKEFHGYDAATDQYFYSSFEESPMELTTYAINGKGVKRKLTPIKGWNQTSFSKNFNYYINTVSNTTTPSTTTLYDRKGKVVRVLEDNKALNERLQQFDLATKEFIQLPAADGKTMLNASLIKPKNFDATKKYPLLVTQYSGPNSQSVKNTWGVSWLDYLAQEGYVVVTIDPRGTGARGEEFRKCTYMQLGKIESDDVIAATRALANESYIDNKNVAIWGWSFGGFMSSLCLMKGADVFSTAISVAPVTNWRYYDTIYTERFMRTPEENPEGYDANSPINWVNKLEGNLLLCHGTADDNVHVQNCYELAEALVQANKQFDMAVYTNRNHSIFGGKTTLHLYTRFVNYLNSNLKK